MKKAKAKSKKGGRSRLKLPKLPGKPRGAKPPESGKFKKGKSGNEAGRPSGSKNLATIVKEVMNHKVSVTIEGKSRKISTAHSALLQLASKAARGESTRDIIAYLDYVDEFERRAESARPLQFPFSEADLEVLQAIYARMKQCSPDLN